MLWGCVERPLRAGIAHNPLINSLMDVSPTLATKTFQANSVLSLVDAEVCPMCSAVMSSDYWPSKGVRDEPSQPILWAEICGRRHCFFGQP